MSTIKDVARMAGVSIATVSRVVNKTSFVEDHTRQLVLDAIESLNYRPNLLARNLKRRESRLILVLVPSITNYIYNDLIAGIEEVARANNYNILVCDVNRDPVIERESLSLLLNKVVDGAIFLGSFLDKEYVNDLAKNHHIVYCCENNNDCDVTFVSIDNYTAAYEATKYLVELGHKDIGLIAYFNAVKASSSVIREDAFRKCLSDYNIPCREDLVMRVKLELFDSLRAATVLLEKGSARPSAILCLADILAWGTLKAASDLKFKVPEDLSIVGFDNILLSSILTPALTTVSQPAYLLGQTAFNLMLETLKGEIKEPKRVLVDHELIIRDSATVLA